MLRDLFPRHHARYEKSQFGSELAEFAVWLAAQGHRRHPLRQHLHRVREALGHSDRFESGGPFDEAELREAFVVSGAPSSTAYLYRRKVLPDRASVRRRALCMIRLFLAEIIS